MRKFTRKDNNNLRCKFDGDDNVFRGMELKTPWLTKVRRRPEEDTAPFLYNDTGTRDFLLKCFPGLATRDHEAIRRATFWRETINYYWRQGRTDRYIETEQGFPPGTIGYTVQQIRRKIRGLRPDGKRYSTRKRGRPRVVNLLNNSNK
jgi:hypothetical protein